MNTIARMAAVPPVQGVKISQLPAASSANPGDLLEVSQADGPTSRSLTLQQIVALAAGVEVITAGTSIVLTPSSAPLIAVNKTVGGATLIALPVSPAVCQRIKVLDARGDAATNPITITGDVIQGGGSSGPSAVINTNGGWLAVVRIGSAWVIEG